MSYTHPLIMRPRDLSKVMPINPMDSLSPVMIHDGWQMDYRKGFNDLMDRWSAQ